MHLAGPHILRGVECTPGPERGSRYSRSNGESSALICSSRLTDLITCRLLLMFWSPSATTPRPRSLSSTLCRYIHMKTLESSKHSLKFSRCVCPLLRLISDSDHSIMEQVCNYLHTKIMHKHILTADRHGGASARYGF